MEHRRKGKPSQDENSPDWVPSLFLKVAVVTKEKKKEVKQKVARFDRLNKRRRFQTDQESKKYPQGSSGLAVNTIKFVGNESMNTPQGTSLNREQKDCLESADVLFSSILNLLSGKAIVSCEVNNGSLECKIRCSNNFPTLTVTYKKRVKNQRNSMPSFELSALYPGGIVNSICNKSIESDSHCSRTVKRMGRRDNELLLESGNNFHVNSREFKIKKINRTYSRVTPAVKAVTSENSCKSNLSSSDCKLDEQNDETTKDEDLLTCSYCGKIFIHKYRKILHERIHTGEKSYSCDYCDKTFTYKSSKVSHERTHTGEKPYSCDYCDKSFACKGSKVIHERSHTGEKPYCCKYCSKHFATSSNRMAHERLHTADKVYYCRYCKESFPLFSLKKEHEMSCARKLTYSCNYCRNIFHSLTSKMAHEPCHGESVNLI